jgi:WD40 repeat protein
MYSTVGGTQLAVWSLGLLGTSCYCTPISQVGFLGKCSTTSRVCLLTCLCCCCCLPGCRVTALAATFGGGCLASGSADGVVRLWNGKGICTSSGGGSSSSLHCSGCVEQQ